MKTAFLHYSASLRRRFITLHKVSPALRGGVKRSSGTEEVTREKTLSTCLKQERLRRGWSQADVAEKIGSDPKTVSRWERGLTHPSLYLQQHLFALFHKTAQELGISST